MSHQIGRCHIAEASGDFKGHLLEMEHFTHNDKLDPFKKSGQIFKGSVPSPKTFQPNPKQATASFCKHLKPPNKQNVHFTY